MANANSKRVHSARYPGRTFPVKQHRDQPPVS